MELDEAARLDEQAPARDLSADLDQAEVEPLPERLAQVGEIPVGEEVVRLRADPVHGRPIERDERVQVLEPLVEEGAVPGAERLLDLGLVPGAHDAPELVLGASEVDGDGGPVIDHGPDLRGKVGPQERVAAHEERDDLPARELAGSGGEGLPREAIVSAGHERPRIAVGGARVAGSVARGAEDDGEEHPARAVLDEDRLGFPAFRLGGHLRVRRQVVEVVGGVLQERLPLRRAGGQEIDFHRVGLP